MASTIASKAIWGLGSFRFCCFPFFAFNQPASYLLHDAWHRETPSQFILQLYPQHFPTARPWILNFTSAWRGHDHQLWSSWDILGPLGRLAKTHPADLMRAARLEPYPKNVSCAVDCSAKALQNERAHQSQKEVVSIRTYVRIVKKNHEKSTYSYFMKVALGSFLGLVVLSSSSKGLEMGTPGRLEPVTKPSALKNT